MENLEKLLFEYGFYIDHASGVYKREDGYSAEFLFRRSKNIMIIKNTFKHKSHVSTSLVPETDDEFRLFFKLIEMKPI